MADFLPTISIKATDLAAEMTGLNVQNKDFQGQNPIEKEHGDNSTAVRNVLVRGGIYPERLPASEDTDKVRRRLVLDGKRVLKKTKKDQDKKK